MTIFPYRKNIEYNGKNYPYEVDFLQKENKFWLMFVGLKWRFKTLEDLENFLKEKSENLILEFITEEWGERVGEWYLPMDAEEREMMQAIDDDFYKKAELQAKTQNILSEIIAENSARKYHKTSLNIFQSDYEKASKIAKNLDMSTQEFLREVINKTLSKV